MRLHARPAAARHGELSLSAPHRSRCAAWQVIAAAGLALASSGHAAAAESRPNILLIVADDLGFSDLGVTGSEIETPVLDALAREGVLFTRFSAMPTCSPSRAALLTGADPHLVGFGTMRELIAPEQRGARGYEGFLTRAVPTLAERLRATGYRTYMAGKWHLGHEANQWPSARGFERSFALLDGGAAHLDGRAYMPGPAEALYVADSRPASVPEGFHSSAHFVSQILGWLQADAGDRRPFFAYLAFTAPHAPLQAPASELERQRGRYDAGWDAVRRARYDRQAALGLVAREAVYPERLAQVPDWRALSETQRAFQARRMEVYAAMVAAVDAEIGRVVEWLRSAEELDRTLIVFLSDNGAEASDFSAVPQLRAWFDAHFDNRLPQLGGPGSYVFPGAGWAQVSGTPNSYFKGLPAAGGVRVPLIVRYPARIPAPRRIAAIATIMDIAPTLLEAAGAGATVPTGRSLWPVLAGAASRAHAPTESIGFELLGSAAIIEDHWKAVRLRAPWGSDSWQLFDLDRDAGEQFDIASEHPRRVRALAIEWQRYAERVGVVAVPADFQPYPTISAPNAASGAPQEP